MRKNANLPSNSSRFDNVGHHTNTVNANLFDQLEIIDGFPVVFPRHCFKFIVSCLFGQYCHGIYAVLLRAYRSVFGYILHLFVMCIARL